MDSPEPDATGRHIAALERAINAKGRIIRTPHGEEVRVRIIADAMHIDARMHHTEDWLPIAQAPKGFDLLRATA